MTILHIVGNRPQFIKLSLLHKALSREDGVRSRIIHTGQHFSDEMSAIFFREFDIPEPDYSLQVHSLPHTAMIGEMLIRLGSVLAADRPDAIVVYGDTNTTLAGALAARKHNIPLMHVEAGIRTGEADMPEESNRYVTDRLADLNFACTSLGVANLLKEGMPASGTFETGDLLLDATLHFAGPARSISTLATELGVMDRPFVLATIHRTENIDRPGALAAIVTALNCIHSDIPVVFPAHPRTEQVIREQGLNPAWICCPPLGYMDMLALVQASGYVITDSGGLSREAFFFHKPSVIVMNRPFWPEIMAHGPSLAAPADTEMIIARFRSLPDGDRPFDTSVFGDGHAADAISRLILEYLWTHPNE
jgi:UDP-GlcNAc3NAcA epimerase